MSLLDVGSGPGTITADFVRLVTPGEVTGLEHSEAALTLTRDELSRQGLAGRADLVVGDVHKLPFPDASFDIVHAHQVLQHVADPVQALREMRRVCKPQGLVAVRDSDYSGFVWWPPEPALDAWLTLYLACARENGGEPDAGRRLLGWAQSAGLRDVRSSSSTWCFATPSDREWWGGMWAARILESDLARQAVDTGRATREELEALSEGWRRWAAAEDGWLSVLHGELLGRP